MGHQSRLASARHWLTKYEDQRIVRGYRKHYEVDLLCAVRELQMLGVKLGPDYVERLKSAENIRIMQRQVARERRKREFLEELYKDSDDRFTFIVEYTSGGFPCGVTWEEMGTESADLEDL